MWKILRSIGMQLVMQLIRLSIYPQIGHDSFLAMFICCLKQLIDKEEAVASYANVGLQFMAKFASSLSKDESEDMHRFLEDVFDWVLKVRCRQKCSSLNSIVSDGFLFLI